MSLLSKGIPWTAPQISSVASSFGVSGGKSKWRGPSGGSGRVPEGSGLLTAPHPRDDRDPRLSSQGLRLPIQGASETKLPSGPTHGASTGSMQGMEIQLRAARAWKWSPALAEPCIRGTRPRGVPNRERAPRLPGTRPLLTGRLNGSSPSTASPTPSPDL